MGSCNWYIRRAQEQGICKLQLHCLVYLPNHLICQSRCSNCLGSSSQQAPIIRSIKKYGRFFLVVVVRQIIRCEKCINCKFQLSYITIYTSFKALTILPSHSHSRYPTNLTLMFSPYASMFWTTIQTDITTLMMV